MFLPFFFEELGLYFCHKRFFQKGIGMFHSFDQLCGAIVPSKKELLDVAQNHLNNLTKPVGSLGRLEEFAAKLFAIYGGTFPLEVDPALHVLAAGDHGVVAEGVAQNPQEVTHLMILNILGGGAGISVLSRQSKMDMVLLDAGHKGACPDDVRAKRINDLEETGNIYKEDAMTAGLCEKLLLAGANTVYEGVQKGYNIFSIGEMGIGNTTPATALFAELFGLDPKEITGPGAGLCKERVIHKAGVIAKALERHKKAHPNADVLQILASLGGFEIAALCGVVLGAAALKKPVIIDGFISTSSYAVAYCMNNAVKDYAFLSHASAEPGYQKIMDCLGEKPMLDLSMRLGEGTGASLALQLLRSSKAVYNEMATFADAKIDTETYLPK